MKILIVEDEFIIAMDLKIKLEDLGYNVLGIENSAETAINKIPEFLPDLVLMDIMLKGEMDGIDATYEIWEQFKIPVLYITAHSDEATMGRINESPGYGFLNKPISTDDLKNAIEMALIRPRICHITKKIRSPLIPEANNPPN